MSDFFISIVALLASAMAGFYASQSIRGGLAHIYLAGVFGIFASFTSGFFGWLNQHGSLGLILAVPGMLFASLAIVFAALNRSEYYV